MPPEFLGPSALLVAALVTVGVLWRDHLRADKDDRDQRDAAISGWKESTTATNRLAAALERQNRDAKRGRSDDK